MIAKLLNLLFSITHTGRLSNASRRKKGMHDLA